MSPYHEPVLAQRVGVVGKKTPGGFPLPLSGEVLATPDVTTGKNQPAEGDLKVYPERCHPTEEELAPDEMRIICLGSGNPYVRRAQAATGWLVQLGNGDNFLFDVGAGTVQNLWSLGFPSAFMDKLFLTHLHLDHVGDFMALFDSMLWGRNRPLNVWGPSGSRPELGTKHFCECMASASSWHIRSKTVVAVTEGSKINATEFDYSKFSPENPRQLVYDENGVKVYAFPVVHAIQGAVGYRLEWNGRSMTFHGDGEPCTFEAEQAAGVDVFMHENFLDAKTFARKNDVPLPVAQKICNVHTTANRLGKLFDIAKPRLGVAYHYHLDDDTVDPFFEGIRSTYKGPVMLAADMAVINVTPQQIVCRMTETDLLHQTPQNPDKDKGKSPGLVLDDLPPKWLSDTVVSPLK